MCVCVCVCVCLLPSSLYSPVDTPASRDRVIRSPRLAAMGVATLSGLMPTFLDAMITPIMMSPVGFYARDVTTWTKWDMSHYLTRVISVTIRHQVSHWLLTWNVRSKMLTFRVHMAKPNLRAGLTTAIRPFSWYLKTNRLVWSVVNQRHYANIMFGV